MNLSELHDCDKCHGKLVSIEVDAMGNSYCGYCHERVDYRSWFEKELKERQAELKDKGFYKALFEGKEFKEEGNSNTWKITKILKKKGLMK